MTVHELFNFREYSSQMSLSGREGKGGHAHLGLFRRSVKMTWVMGYSFSIVVKRM